MSMTLESDLAKKLNSLKESKDFDELFKFTSRIIYLTGKYSVTQVFMNEAIRFYNQAADIERELAGILVDGTTTTDGPPKAS